MIEDLLAKSLASEYGIAARAITRIPRGFASTGYRIDGADGRTYFVKRWSEHASATDVRQHETILGLMRALATRCPALHVPAPIPTVGGGLSAKCAGAAIALFPFVEGTALPRLPAPTQQRALGQALAVLHRATDSLSDLPVKRETFSLPFAPLLRAAVTTDAAPEDVRARLLPRAADVLGALDDLVARAAALRSSAAVFVICHTDMAGDNVILREDGTLAILDWDEALLAPAEADLWDLAPATLIAYLDAGGVADIDADRLTFYARRRALEDMAARVARLGDRATPAEARARLLADIDEWGFDRLDSVAARVGSVIRARDVYG